MSVRNQEIQDEIERETKIIKTSFVNLQSRRSPVARRFVFQMMF